MNKNSTILITGGTGFVGSHLTEALLARGLRNIFVTTASDSPSFVHDLLPAEQIIKVDLTDVKATFELFERVKPDLVFHLAAIATVGHSFEAASAIFQNNILLQLNVLEAIKDLTPEARIMVVGSGMEYGLIEKTPISEDAVLNPTDPYAVSKITQDFLGVSYAHSAKLDVIRVRPFNHIGERQSPDFAIPAFASQIVAIERGQQDKIMVGNLEATRDLSDVKDVVQAYIFLMEKGDSGEVYNIGSGQGRVMKDVLAMMTSLANVDIQVEVDENRLRPIDVPVSVADISKIKNLGWSPTIPLEETLKRVIEEWRAK